MVELLKQQRLLNPDHVLNSLAYWLCHHIYLHPANLSFYSPLFVSLSARPVLTPTYSTSTTTADFRQPFFNISWKKIFYQYFLINHWTLQATPFELHMTPVGVGTLRLTLPYGLVFCQAINAGGLQPFFYNLLILLSSHFSCTHVMHVTCQHPNVKSW